MKVKNIPTLLFLFFLSTTLFANPQELFKTANEAYQKGSFKKAIENYEALLASDNFSQEVYFNLGNAYFKSNQLGKAILNYERGLLLYPGDPDTQFNLKIAQDKQVDDLDVVGKFFLSEWWKNTYQFFSSGVWSTLTILSIWTSIAGFIFWTLGTTRTHKKQGFVIGIFLAFLSILFFFLTRSQANFETNSGSAIVIQQEIEVKNAPDEASTNLLKIHEGLRVDLLDEIGTWYKIKLSNGEQGWLPKNSLEEI